MNDYAFFSISQLQELLSQKKVTAEELVQYFLDRFGTHDKKINSAIELFDAQSILAASPKTGSLYGMPGILKDNIAQQGRPLTCGSKILNGFVSPYDATATQRLKSEGAPLIGRANMDEFAMGTSNEYSAYGPCMNPWDTTRVAGGSSGGPVAAVAAGFVPWALGSETGGSVRTPACWCGVVGLKPTYGLISRYGLVAYGSSLDQLGIATRTVADNARILSIIAGHDALDSTTIEPFDVKTDYTRTLDGKLPDNFTLGVIENMLYAEGVDPEVQERILAAIDEYKKLGAKIKLISIPEIDYGAAVYFIVSRAESASNLARFDGVRYGYRAPSCTDLQDMYEQTRTQGFGKEVRARILVGNYVLSVGHAAHFYHNACKVRRLMALAIDEAFKGVDLMLTPVTSAPAFKLGAFAQDPLAMDLTDYFTCFASLTHIPALSVPCGFVKNNQLPTAFQLVGPECSEALLYKVAHAYERVTPWHTMYPSL